ncbi:MAG: hypothetical protein A3B99_04730 [Candidatus Yanofskybacteria bacterium RIFCSPHIGHO2_02_FULL_44_12b]|uniref:Uncharacterized protein n=2 Tax=Candidatus Yanofskyibacteriota TaxID=1752733 RepID=A0A1F8GK32_9BACT|nr:MAG: hypothetical protein UW79_C0003G0014 [Candidatus Yanofskybacteria bacterium GW2011_GWA2_44_9]OGN04372.1 MAG: hypothetical protein A2659_03530 [Candidatus Yanofskybacteria bacterium RIFCSPHIGHO2_01_FULL_44_24]OGN14481.1 MAG: hypothetical protein A3B99_04730 [Candidatus Yanofskybacteria bacterium RIFCSPHIGHO2_02_FULL_44_12b]OGN25762.1 MAG: hypothetical protein A2925_01070 [Candidatus Yanofskybacteria bacterium RIFCSPLOWO2_01_FULL_44_22]
MALKKVQKEIADKIGKLLAASPLDGKVKSSLIENLDKLPESMVFRLLDALEAEKETLDQIAFEGELFLREQEKRWAAAAKEQQKAVDILIAKWSEKLS